MQRHVLDNGLTVLLLPEPESPLVSVAMMYRVGARNEAAGTTGLAHYVEHMNFRATAALPGAEITEAITRIGGRWTGYTWIDQTYYAETVPKHALPRMLDLERERMTAARYDPEDFHKERTSVIAELHTYEDPASLLGDAVLAAAFELHPYRHNTIGWLTDVEQVTRDDAYAFYRRFYHPDNAVLVIAGGFDAAQALQQVRERFAALPQSGVRSAVRSIEPPQRGERRVVVRRPGPQARLLMAFRAPALGDADFPVMVLFDALLAGGKGFHFTTEYATAPDTLLRQRSGASDAASHWQASPYPYVWTLSAAAAGEAELLPLEQSLRAVVAEAGTRAWSEAERARAVTQVTAGWAQDLDTLAGRAHQLAFFEVAGDHAALRDLPQRVAHVTGEQLRRFARERLQPSQATVGWFVPTPGDAAVVADAPAPAEAPTTLLPPVRVGVAAEPQQLSLPNGVRATLVPLAGSALVTLVGRLGVSTPGLTAVLAQLLAAPGADEPLGVPTIAWRPLDEPAALAHARTIEFSASCLPDQVPALLEALGTRLARIARGSIPPDVWQRAVEAALAHAAQQAESSDSLLLAAALAELYPAGSDLAHPAWSEALRLLALRLPDTQALLASHVGAAHLQLALAGAVDAEVVRASVERSFGSLPAQPVGTPAAGPPARRAGDWKQLVLPRPDQTQNELAVVWPGDRARPADAAATRALLYLLGETGYAGMLGRALVEPGLVYWVAAHHEAADAVPGFLMIRTAAAVADTPEVLRRIRAILEEIPRHRFTPEELAEAQAYLRGKAARGREGSRAAASAALEAADPSADALTLGQLQDTARRLLANGAPVAIVAGPGPTLNP